MSKREKSREICHIRGVAQSDVGNWEYEPIWKPDPDAPSVAEVVEQLTSGIGAMGLLADYLERDGQTYLAANYRERVDEARNLIVRLEGA